MQRRRMCSLSSVIVKQVSKANFSLALSEIKDHIKDSDFVALSCVKTGLSSSPWTRILPIDTSQTAYLKAKAAAERFELLQFSVCPFKLRQSKIIAFPYNFHLFPRDELHLGMPSYSFSCQTSSLTSLAREGFDFNICVYDGISYLSRAQEPMAKHRARSPIPVLCQATSISSTSVADTIFMERIKSKVVKWRDACKNSTETTGEALVTSLRKLIFGGEIFGSRPCLNINVCNDNQVQLVVKTANEVSDDLVPLVISEKGMKSVRIVYTNSEEDKNHFKSDVQNLEEEQSKQVHGFRAVIDVISSANKPLVAYNCLTDFAFIHSKFLAPLPQNMSEFMHSLQTAFSNILDINHLLKEIGPLKKANSLPSAASYLKRYLFVPFELEIPQQASDGSDGKIQGQDVLLITDLFAKLSSILNISSHEAPVNQNTRAIEDYANTFYPCCSDGVHNPRDGNTIEGMETVRKVRTDSLVFLWGFQSGISVGALKSCLNGIHSAFAGDYDLRLVDKSCAVVVLQDSTSAEALLKDMASGAVSDSGSLQNMISEGLKGAGYGAYTRVCQLGLWEESLADALDKALIMPSTEMANAMNAPEIYGSSYDWMIDLDEL